MVRNVIMFYGEGLLAPRPTPKLEDHPLSAVRDCLFNVFATTLHTWRPFLHPQPEDAPCRGDRDPLNMDQVSYAMRNWDSFSEVKAAGRGDAEHSFLCSGSIHPFLPTPS
jgi:hypothetical protein